MTFAVGSLVQARGREWIVLPESRDDLLVLRPLGGSDEEIAGVYLPLEAVEPATFHLPDPARIGDNRSGRLLREAVRLGFRSSAGPFRSMARIAVEPRSYQLVPLLMAMKLDPVRLLIADDVGIGKTVEAGLVARELLDRGEARRLAVLTPPHLADQWARELLEKFHIEAVVVAPHTARSLERRLLIGQSLFEAHPFTVVSLDFIKAERRRFEFQRSCPDVVIVDEAHTCASAGAERGERHLRHDLVSAIASDADRHLILVSATPHCGKEETFRSLLTLLRPDFAHLPGDLAGAGNLVHRRALAAHFVQRRRGDIRRYLDERTLFPEREDREETYRMSDRYRRFFDRVLAYAREKAGDPSGNRLTARIRWWAALALLRSVGSSPAAAAATLRTRAAALEAATEKEADAIGRRTVLDTFDEDSDGFDVAAGTDTSPAAPGDATPEPARPDRRLRELATEADSLRGRADTKLETAIALVEGLLEQGRSPIVFTRFIPTADYVAEELRRRLGSRASVESVTSVLPPPEREARVAALGRETARVLVATDCLSEGINLQESFDTVLHYDLSWNPTRHEQREGRVDRYGQPRPTVQVVTYFGSNSSIDGIVLDVLLRKHRAIRSALGISVPVPVDPSTVMNALVEGLLLRRDGRSQEEMPLLPGFEEALRPTREVLHRDWDASADREKRSRTVFAQETIKVDEVAREIEAVRDAIGSRASVERFVRDAFTACGAAVVGTDPVRLDLREAPAALRDVIGETKSLTARFELPVTEGQVYLSRTHPLVEGLAGYVAGTSLDPALLGVARRAGVMRTDAVRRRTTLLLLRCRYHILEIPRDGTPEDAKALLAEDCRLVAFEGAPEAASWLPATSAEALLDAEPRGNIDPDQAASFARKVVESYQHLRPAVEQAAVDRGRDILDAHVRVRRAARRKGITHRVEPKLPADILGIYVLLPLA